MALVVALLVPAGGASFAIVPRLAGPGPPGFTPTSVGSSDLSGAWTQLTMPPEQPDGLAGVALGFDAVHGLGVLFGGRDGNGTVLNDTWLNDGDHPGQWAEEEGVANASPPPLVGAALAFSPTTGTFLLFGGERADGDASGATWQFQDFAWTNLTPGLALSPPADPAPSLAFDASDGYSVLLDSRDPGVTWTFGAAGWARAVSADSPPGRSSGALIADASTNGVLLFGGISVVGPPTPLNDTWRYVAGSWAEAATGLAPPAQGGAAMAFDPRIPGALLVSGSGSPRTWTFANGAWAARPSSPEPPARTEAALYFDSNVDHDILLGGIDGASQPLPGAWGWSVPPTSVDPTIGAAPIGTATWIEIAGIAVVPIVLVLLFRLRPPRVKPSDAPERAPASSPA